MSEHSARRIGESRYGKIADGTTWPLPDTDDGGVAWKLTYAPDSMTTEDRLYAASIISAYGHLTLEANRPKRDLVAGSIRAYFKRVRDAR